MATKQVGTWRTALFFMVLTYFSIWYLEAIIGECLVMVVAQLAPLGGAWLAWLAGAWRIIGWIQIVAASLAMVLWVLVCDGYIIAATESDTGAMRPPTSKDMSNSMVPLAFFALGAGLALSPADAWSWAPWGWFGGLKAVLLLIPFAYTVVIVLDLAILGDLTTLFQPVTWLRRQTRGKQ